MNLLTCMNCGVDEPKHVDPYADPRAEAKGALCCTCFVSAEEDLAQDKVDHEMRLRLMLAVVAGLRTEAEGIIGHRDLLVDLALQTLEDRLVEKVWGDVAAAETNGRAGLDRRAA